MSNAVQYQDFYLKMILIRCYAKVVDIDLNLKILNWLTIDT